LKKLPVYDTVHTIEEIAELEQGFYNRILRSRHFDGVIMLSSDVDDPLLPLLMKDRMPLVLIGSHPYFQNISWVDVDNREGAHAAVTHLIGLGHRRIATITGPLQMAVAPVKADGYKRALLEAGLTVARDLIVEGDFTQAGGYRAMLRLLALPQRPTATSSPATRWRCRAGELRGLAGRDVRRPAAVLD
jgi:DNA-binding LacI/PurR family transcriptional regulator